MAIKLTAVDNVQHDGKALEAGDVFSVETEEAAADLVEAGVAVRAKGKAEKPAAGEGQE